MSSVSEKLHNWALQELNLVSEGPLNRIPDVSDLNCLTEGKNKKIWIYIINHIRSRATVKKVKRTLALKRMLKACDDDVLESYFHSDKSDLKSLQQDIVAADEKRVFLETSLSVVRQRILSTEQHIRNIKDDLLKVKQKCAFLDLLVEKNREKNESLKILLNELVPYLPMLKAYCGPQVSETVQEKELVFDKGYLKGKDLVNRMVSIIERKLNGNTENSAENNSLQSDIAQMLRSDGLIKMLVILKKLCQDDLENFLKFAYDTQPINEFIEEQKKSDPYNDLLNNLKYRHICCYMDVKQHTKKLHELSEMKEKVFDKVKSLNFDSDDPDLIAKCNLLKNLAENKSFIEGNKYLDECFREQQSYTETLSKKVNKQKLKTHDLKDVTKILCKNSYIAYMLTGTASKAFGTIDSSLDSLYSFVDTEVFNSELSLENYPAEFEKLSKSDVEIMLAYADKTNLIKTFVNEPYKSCPLSNSVVQSFNILPFQNISTACNRLVSFKKQLLQYDCTKNCLLVLPKQMDLAEEEKSFMVILSQLDIAVQKGTVNLEKANSSSGACNILLDEWLKQRAQFILPIEYKGRSLKTWIDILKVLPDFQSQYLPCNV